MIHDDLNLLKRRRARFRVRSCVAALALGISCSLTASAFAADTIFKDGYANSSTPYTSSSQTNLKGGRAGPDGQQLIQFTTMTIVGSSIYASVTASAGNAADMTHAAKSGKSRCTFRFINGVSGTNWIICKYRK